MEEIWKDIEGYEGIYQVSNFGNIKRLKGKYVSEEREVSQSISNCGYYTVELSYHNESKRFLVHRLVAQAFLINARKYPCVNHKDGNKKNNYVDNLEWCTHKYNYEEAVRIGLIKNPKEYGRTKEVVQYDLNNNYIKTWESFADIKKVLGFNIQNICQCCKNKKKTMYGYIWKYKEA